MDLSYGCMAAGLHMAVFALEGRPVTLAARDGQLVAVWHSTAPSSPKDQVRALPALASQVYRHAIVC